MLSWCLTGEGLHMKALLFSSVLVSLLLFCRISASADQARIIENYGKIPLSFTINNGQYDPQVKFVTRGSGCTMFFTQEGTTFLLSRETEESIAKRNAQRSVVYIGDPSDIDIEREQFALKVKFLNANPDPDVVGENPLPGKSNYFSGNDPTKWQTDVATYEKVRLKNLYDGIDLVYYGNGKSVKYDFLVKSGEDPSRILLTYDLGDDAHGGALSINENGEMVVSTPLGDIIERKPFAYQRIKGDIVEVPVKYEIVDAERNIYAFIPGEYDRGMVLVIDPEMVWSTFYTGSPGAFTENIAMDSNGNVYLTGAISSSDFPVTTGAYDATYNNKSDIYVMKINPLLTSIVYATYIGGSELDQGMGIGVDANGYAYVTGYTWSSDFPTTPGAFDRIYDGSIGVEGTDIIALKLNPAGSGLVYSTFIGGSGQGKGQDRAYKGVVDNLGNFYIQGGTRSSNFPVTSGAYDTTWNGGEWGDDAFLSKLNNTGSGLIFSTYLGGSNGTDFSLDLTLDNSGNIYLCGVTSSTNFPVTSGAYDTSYNGAPWDCFVAKFNSDASSLLFSTFIGSSGDERANNIALDSSGNIFVGCMTNSSNFPTTQGAFDTSYNGDWNSAIVKLSSSGNALLNSTYLGKKASTDYSVPIYCNTNGDIYIGGDGASDYPVTPDALYPTNANGSGVLSIMNSSLSTMIFSTFARIRIIEILKNPSGEFILGGTDSNVAKFVLSGSFTLASPNGSESWTASSSRAITWTSSGVTNVKLEYTTDNGTSWTTIIASTPASANSYSWTVPNVSSTNCLVKITDTANATVTDQSNAVFTIVQPGTVAVTSPNGGESWTASSSHNITWTYSGVTNVTLLYSTNNGGGWTQITASTAASSGSYSWTVPNVSSATCLVKITDTANATVTDQSNAVFTIVQPGTVAVISPNGGETWTTGSSRTITWTSSNVTNIKIEYSTNGGSSWTQIIASTAASANSYSWTVPNVSSSTNCLVRITDTANASVTDQSNAVFTIQAAATVRLTAPVGGEVWSGGTAQTITWTSSGVTTVRIEYSRDLGSTWTPIISNASALSGTYSWTVPGLSSASCLVRITDTANNTVTGMSGNSFSIVSPEIELSSNTLAFGDVDVSTSRALTFMISNSGAAALTVSGMTCNSALFSVSPASATVTSGQNLSVTVTFSPVARGQQSAAITLSCNDVDERTLTINVTGTGVSPEIALSVTSIALGNVNVGSSNSGTFVITNEGNTTLTVSSITSSSNAFTVTPASASVGAAGQSPVTVTVTFTPVQRGSQSATITIASNDSDEPSLTVTATGTGLAPEIALSTTTLAFGDVNVGSSTIRTFTIINEGNGPLVVSGISSNNPSFTVTPTSASVGAGQSTTVTVAFTPVQRGSQSATITVSSNDSDEPSLTVGVTGTGLSPEIAVSPASVPVGGVNVGASASWSFVITNEGNSTLTVSGITSDNARFTVSPQSASIPAGESRTVTVTFTPAERGNQSVVITVTSNDSDEATLIVETSGTGLSPEITLPTVNLSLGDVNVPGVVSGMFTIVNEGNAPLIVSSITSDNEVFTVSPQTLTVEADTSAPVDVTFSPVVRGEQSATITILSNDADEPSLTVQVSGTGRLSDMTVSSASIAFGDVDAGSSSQRTFMITNNGNDTLQVTSIISSHPEFTVTPSSASVTAGESVTVTVTFSPVSMGERSGVITVVSGERTLTVQVNGIGRAPEIALSIITVIIGDVDVGSSGTGTFTITNEGNSPLTVGSISSDNDAFTVDQTAMTLNAGESEEVTVTFSPGVAGGQTAQLTVLSSDSDEGTLTVTVTSTGMSAALSISPQELDCGDVLLGNTASAAFLIRNEGNADVGISSIACDNEAFTVSPSSVALAGGQEQQVTVGFIPSLIGEQSGTITIQSDISGGAVYTVPVRGTGLGAEITVAPGEIDAGSASPGESSTGTFTITNEGNVDLTIESIQSDTGLFTIDIASATVRAGESVTVTVTFTPAQLGEIMGTITIISNDSDEAHITVPVRGRGTAAPITIVRFVLATENSLNTVTGMLDVVLEVRNESNEALSNITLSCFLDDTGLPPDYGDHDNDGDGDIDRIEAGETVRALVARTGILSDVNAHTLTVRSMTIDGTDYAVVFSASLGCTYAVHDTDVPYHPSQDGYHFANPPGWSWRRFLEECSTSDPGFGTQFNTVFPFFSMTAQWKGRCLGMAASSNIYFEDPSMKPVDLPTSQMNPEDSGVINNIFIYSLSMLWKYLSLTDPMYSDMTLLLSDARGYLSQNRPCVLVIRDERHIISFAHAVSVYKVIEDKTAEEAVLVVYDSAYDDGIPRFASISLGDNTFSYEGYDRAGILVQSSIAPGYSITERIFRPFNRKFVRELWDTGENFFGHASPARMLVTNKDNGRRVGFENGTTLVNEIDAARIIEIAYDEGMGYAFYVPRGPSYDVTFYGLESGTMFVDVITPTSETEAAEVRYEDVAIEPRTVAVIENVTVIEETPPRLKIDNDADGSFETELTSSAFEQIDIGPVTGVGPKIELSGSVLSVGQVALNGRGSVTITISNTGDEDLIVSRISVENTMFALTPSSAVIAPDGSETVSVTFTPDSLGIQNASLSIQSNDAVNSALSVSVEGDGIGVLVTAPNGGEELKAGSSYEITWNYRGVTAVTIDYSADGGTTWQTIAVDQSAQNASYIWTIPDSESYTSLIRITDVSLTALFDVSDNTFRIMIPEISISHNPILEARELDELIFTATVTSSTELEHVTLYYDVSGRRIFDRSVSMTSMGGNEYSAMLESGIFSGLGMEYYVIAEDTQGNEIRTPSASDFYSISARIPELASTYQIMGGSSVTAYRMISVPLSLTATTIEEQLQGRLPAGKSGTDWRLFQYLSDAEGYKEYPAIDGFTPGKAYWLIIKEGNTFNQITPEGKTVSTSERFNLTLKPGWNDIASPWMFDISWDDVENPSGANLSVPYTYGGNWSDPMEPPLVLEPWKGSAVFNFSNMNVAIKLNPEPAVSTGKPAADENKFLWMMTVQAHAGGASDVANHVGVTEGAKPEWDQNDHVEPPPVGDYVTVTFPHRDWKTYPYDYTVDIRPPGNTLVWDFTVKTNIPHETVAVQLMGTEKLPSEYSHKIFDLDMGQVINGGATSFGFVSGNDFTERHFRLVVTNSQEPEDEYTSRPEKFIIARCYPNPFNPQTTIQYEISTAAAINITVYNMVGQQVAVYSVGRKEPGIHEVVFDAKNLTSGIYFYRVDAGYARVTGKMLFMK